MRGFIPYQNEDGRVAPWEYLPCGAITPKLGMALVQSSGNLAIAAGTTKPTYISMCEKSAACTAGDIIPVVKVQPDQVFETTRLCQPQRRERGGQSHPPRLQRLPGDRHQDLRRGNHRGQGRRRGGLPGAGPL